MEPDSFSRYIDTLIAGKYSIDKLIGKGGFAWVFHAQTEPHHEVAIKILHSDDENTLARFEREVEVLKSLPSNRHIPTYVDSGLTSDGRPFLAIDYVYGVTLLQLVKSSHSMDVRQCAALVADLCKAFNELHRLGVAHRDVKPENILVDCDGDIKLIDFGLIRDAQGILQLLEQTDPVDQRVFTHELDRRALVGTPEYMAPEQFSDAIVSDVASIRTDTWSDIYSLGVILFEIIAGVVPFPMPKVSGADDIGREIFKYMRHRICLSEDDVPRCPFVDSELDSIIRKTLRQDPRQRQPDAQILRQDLIRYLTTGKGVSRTLQSRTVDLSVFVFEDTDDAEDESVVDDKGDREAPTNPEVLIDSRQTPQGGTRPRVVIKTEATEKPKDDSLSDKPTDEYVRRQEVDWAEKFRDEGRDPLRDTLHDHDTDDYRAGSSDLLLASVFDKAKLKKEVLRSLMSLDPAVEEDSREITKVYDRKSLGKS